MPQAKIQAWLDGPYDEETKREIREKLQNDPKSLQDAFFKDISFGTGGLRAEMGVGTNRLNQYTIQKATQALANYLRRVFSGPISVFIGYDVRNNSREFALYTARVLAGNGIRALVTEDICPTPLASFGCRHFGCNAAVMITASHNPPQYNGYKVYWQDGGQIVAPHDQNILAEMQKIRCPDQIQLAPIDSPLIQYVDDSLDEAYLERLSENRLYSELPPLKVLYSPLHGTGGRIIPKALKAWGFSPSLVEDESTPDGNFPNVASPNPEEATALEKGAKQLIEEGKDLFLATDPDADRVGAVINHHGTAVFLTGNQIACLCLHHICEALHQKKALLKEHTCIKTIVTTELFRKIAASYNLDCIDVLTGFKYIGEKIELWEKEKTPRRYLFGGEESYGYLFGSFVRDKDAISSSALIAEAAAFAKSQEKTLLDRLHLLYERYGVHLQSLTNISLPDGEGGSKILAKLMKNLRENPPQGAIRIQDYESMNTGLPPANVLKFYYQDGSTLVIRPSGTEPKLKIYAEVIDKTTESCKGRLYGLVKDFRLFLGY